MCVLVLLVVRVSWFPPPQPYTVNHYRCVAGVQVTASHNPKEYNGYKVYWDNGAQVSGSHHCEFMMAMIMFCLY